ncbi:uri1, prefoldin-like chaperone [Coemansia sp. RSA 1972]|nr:uri1, prefoldin-like chaperone [Coemansia sp. RSA 1972]
MSSKKAQPAGPSTTTTTYAKYLEHTTASVKTALAQYTEYKTEYQQLQQTLRDLPTETEYEAMVPMGPLAFFPGSLINTNEILVLLGDNWFVERSAAQAVEIASRREQFVDAKITATTQELLELERRVELLKLDPVSSDVGRELGGDITNELGEKVVDIKEEIGENEDVAFADDDLVGGDASSKGKAVDKDPADQDAESVQDAMRMKRERMIQALSEPRTANDRSDMSAEDRAMLDALDRIEDDDDEEDDDEEDDDDDYEEVEDGDAFSDEDRAYIARDDDEDDFNDTVPEHDEDTRRMPTSILKPSRSGGRRTKSVSFDPTPTLYETPSHELLDDSNNDDDVDKVTRLIGQLRTAACPAPSSKLISVIGESSAPRFTPNTAMSGVRSKSKQTSAQPQAPQKTPQKDTQPLRHTVVEHAPQSDPESDNDMHALEIAHAYSQMRQKRMAAGEFDGAAGVADLVLEATPGVTLIDGHVRGNCDDDDVDIDENGFERIELPAGDSELHVESSMRPPEVVRAPRRAPVVSQNTAPVGLSEEVKETQPNAHVAPKEQIEEIQPKPKMSRFKAQRLGLS